MAEVGVGSFSTCLQIANILHHSTQACQGPYLTRAGTDESYLDFEETCWMRVAMVQLGLENTFLPLGNRKAKGWVSIAWDPFTLFGETGGRAHGNASVYSGYESSEQKLTSY